MTDEKGASRPQIRRQGRGMRDEKGESRGEGVDTPRRNAAFARSSFVLVVICLLSVFICVICGRSFRKAPGRFVHHPDGGFKVGECTWYAYQRVQDDGWRLAFTQSYGRHARAWWELAGNTSKSEVPVAGSVMIFDAWPGNPYGHVAYVESVESGGKWVISHANFGLGEQIDERDGVAVRRAEFESVPGGVRLVGSRHVYRIRGFLSHATL